ncbi:MAG: PadR family transcriptional regulator [Firmicutes bacterium]|nr:PadR family transcriptional regulator [Bacillota bacterium]
MDNNVEKEVVMGSDIFRGYMNTIILCSLLDGNKFGEEIFEYLNARSGGRFPAKLPTIYSALSRLEQKGCINSYWGGGEARGGRRKYYSLTELGKEIADQGIKEWEYSRTIIDSLIL